MGIAEKQYDNSIVQGGTYPANIELELTSVAVTDINVQKVIDCIILSNYSTNQSTITIKIDNNILITYNLSPGEYMRYEGPLLIKSGQKINVICTESSVDITLPLIEILIYEMS